MRRTQTYALVSSANAFSVGTRNLVLHGGKHIAGCLGCVDTKKTERRQKYNLELPIQ